MVTSERTITDVLDRLNRDLVELRDRYNAAATEAYPGMPGEVVMPPAEYCARFNECCRLMDTKLGISLARELVLETRHEATP